MLSFNPKHLTGFQNFFNAVKDYITRISSLIVEGSINSRAKWLSNYKRVRYSLQPVLYHQHSFAQAVKVLSSIQNMVLMEKA